jgi:intraflagellar transport protein 88
MQSSKSSLKILANIGIASIKVSKFQDAVSSFESIMEDGPSFFAGNLLLNIHGKGFNLILCYFALGEKEKMKNGFRKMLGIQLQTIDNFDEQHQAGQDEPIQDHAVFTHDALRDIAQER